jgi:hypothetical protein
MWEGHGMGGERAAFGAGQQTAVGAAGGLAPPDPGSLLTEPSAPATVVLVAPSAADPAEAEAPVVPTAFALAEEETMGVVGVAGSSFSTLSTKDRGMRAALQGAMIGSRGVERRGHESKTASEQGQQSG